MNITFNFQEALSYIKAGLVVELEINGKKRLYYLNKDSNIMCIPNNKEYLAYEVKDFKIDAIMSENWTLAN